MSSPVERVIGFRARHRRLIGCIEYLRKMLDVVLFPELSVASQDPVEEAVDISPALIVGMGVFPGDAAFEVSQTFAIGRRLSVQ